MEPEILSFTQAIGAKAPSLGDENYAKFKAIFKRSNYFIYNKHFAIVKISRSDKPFWGIGKKYIDLLNLVENYFVVLLVNDHEGYVFCKKDVNKYIAIKDWGLASDDNYKINYPLPMNHGFSSTGGCKRLMDKNIGISLV